MALGPPSSSRPKHYVVALTFVLLFVSIIGLIGRKWMERAATQAPSPQETPDLEKTVESAMLSQHLNLAVARYQKALKEGHADEKDDYFAGYSYMEMDLFDKAQLAFERAVKNHYKPYPRWDTPETFLRRLATIHRLAPRFLQPRYPRLRAHAGKPDAWTRPLLKALPDFARIGRQIYGSDIPDMNLYVFTQRQDYLDFFKAVTGMGLDTPWQDATGSVHFAVCCEVASRPAGEAETVADVLHEFGHGWAITYLRDKYDKPYLNIVRPWADEGLADYVATLWDKDHLNRRREWIQRYKVAKGIPPPAFDELQTHAGFYYHGDPDLHYWMGDFLFDRMLGKDGAAKIPAYLDALARTGDSNKALSEISGLDPEKEYNALVKEIWNRPRPLPLFLVNLILGLVVIGSLSVYFLKKRLPVHKKRPLGRSKS